MKILMVGDLHGDVTALRNVFSLAARGGASRIMQLGDFGYGWDAKFFPIAVGLVKRYNIPLYWLDGNHENFDLLEASVDMAARKPVEMAHELWYCPRGAVWRWGSKRFMSFGGAYSVDKYWRMERQGWGGPKLWWEQELPTEEQKERARHRGEVDVLLTHDAPRNRVPFIVEDDGEFPLSQQNRNWMSELQGITCPQVIFHGHYHHRYTSGPGLWTPRVEGLNCNGSRASQMTYMLDTGVLA